MSFFRQFISKRKQVVLKSAKRQILKLSDFKNLLQLINSFKTEKQCIEFYIELRWPGRRVTCPHCKTDNPDRIHHKDDQINFQCYDCGQNFSYTVGAIFQNTKITLKQWFIAVYMIGKNGEPANAIADKCNVTLKTAGRMLQRLRFARSDANERFLFERGAEIQSDEAINRSTNSNRAAHKRDVNSQGRSLQISAKIWFGLIDKITRKLKLFHITNTDENLIVRLIKKYVLPFTVINTDDYRSYRNLKIKGLFKHFVVKHGAKQWCNGSITTNLIENIWTHVKRLIEGIYRHVSAKHTQAYLNEFTHRFNIREAANEDKFEDTLNECNGKYITLWDIKNGLGYYRPGQPVNMYQTQYGIAA